MFVLQVGIGKYKHTPTWTELRGAVTDVVEMRKVLESERYGIPAENIVTLTDAQATKAAIFEKFQSHLITNARTHYEKTRDRKDGAIVLFQFSGHGSQVPDIDGDEKDDGKDETLVTVDSQDAPGKNFDITDDEIYALTSRLSPYTDNIDYIFDSCHSGSGTRDAQDVRRLPEKQNPVVPIPGFASTTTRSGAAKEEDGTSGVLPPGTDYIVITAARANELASQKNCFEECGDARRPVVYGNLTFYLIDELKNARNDTSYRELMENVTRRVVAEKPTQTPQIEGDRSRFVFGSLASKEDHFVPIAEAGAKKTVGAQLVRIRAGAMQGVTVDTVVTFYDKAVTLFDQASPVASGLTKTVSPMESVVEVVAPAREVKLDDKASVGTPDLGKMRLKVNLDADAGKLTAEQKTVIEKTRDSLTPGPGAGIDLKSISLVTGASVAAGNWDVAVLKDKFSTVAEKVGGELTCEVAGNGPGDAKSKPEADTDVFYVAGRDFVPMYRFCLDAKPSADAAALRLRDVVYHLAHLRSVNAIANRRSALRGKVTVKPMRLTGPFDCDTTKSLLTYGGATPAVANPATGYYPFKTGEVFWLEVTNNSGSDLYLTLLDLGADGSVKLHSPRPIESEERGVKILANGGKRILIGDDCRSVGDQMEAGALVLSPPAGLETLKLIASVRPTKNSQFVHLVRPALTRNEKATLVGLDDWTTVETILQIIDTGK
jgi:hypothetical protein